MPDDYDVSSVLLFGLIAIGTSELFSVIIAGMDFATHWFYIYQLVGLVATFISWIYADNRRQDMEMAEWFYDRRQ